jgi:hypothetical protein
LKHQDAVEHIKNLILNINQDVKSESLDVEVKFQKTPKFFGRDHFMEMPDPLHVEDYRQNEKEEEENDIEPTIELLF